MKAITFNDVVIPSLLLFVSTSYVSTTYAQNINQQEWDIKIGATVESYSSLWVGGDRQNDPLPFFDARYENWRCSGQVFL